MSVDPLTNEYPNLTPYHYCANPIIFIDPNGMRHEISEEAWLAGWFNANEDGSFNSDLAVAMNIIYNGGYEAALTDLKDFGPTWINNISNTIQTNPFAYMNEFSKIYNDINSFKSSIIGVQYPNQAEVLAHASDIGSTLSYTAAGLFAFASPFTGGVTLPFAYACLGAGTYCDLTSTAAKYMNATFFSGNYTDAHIQAGSLVFSAGLARGVTKFLPAVRTSGAAYPKFRISNRFITNRTGYIMTTSSTGILSGGNLIYINSTR